MFRKSIGRYSSPSSTVQYRAPWFVDMDTASECDSHALFRSVELFAIFWGGVKTESGFYHIFSLWHEIGF